jgi:hypothetical protein
MTPGGGIGALPTDREALGAARRPPEWTTLIQAHPSRAAEAERLAVALSGAAVYDPDPGEPPSPWRSYAAAIIAAPRFTHVLIIQDDAEPHPALLSILPRIIARHPTRLVALYHGRHPQANAIRLSLARDRGLAYAEMRAGRYVPSVALLWPKDYVDLAKRWLPKRIVAADDEMISRMLTQNGHYQDKYLVTVPSLVEHPDVLPSLMGGKRYPRTAIIPPPSDPLPEPWESRYLPYL